MVVHCPPILCTSHPEDFPAVLCHCHCAIRGRCSGRAGLHLVVADLHAEFWKGNRRGSGVSAKSFWTLAVEEQFYFAWPWIVLFATPRQVFRISGACCILGVTYRIMAWSLGADGSVVTQFTPACLDPLCVGAMLAVCRHTGEGIRFQNQAVIFCLALTLLLLVFATKEVFLVFYRFPCAVCFALLIDRAASGRMGFCGKILGWRPIAYVGKISYGIYVFHLLVLFVIGLAPIGISAESVAGRVGLRLANFAVLVGVTVAVAALSWEVFERPLNEMKRFFPYIDRNALTSKQ